MSCTMSGSKTLTMLPSMMMMLRPMSRELSAHHGWAAVGAAARWLVSVTTGLSEIG